MDAQDVTIRQILAEWARLGKTSITNLERVSGGPITLKLEGIPEKQALEIILRGLPGYIALPREPFVADASVYDRILVMASTTVVAPVRAPAAMLPGGRGGSNITQLRPGPPPMQPGMPVGFPNPPAEEQYDAAIAAAAAAGLVAVPALAPGPSGVSAPLTMPGSQQSGPASPAATPANPWSAPVGTPQPSLAAPPPPSPAPPLMRPPPPPPSDQ
jgi:hypothetical protein